MTSWLLPVLAFHLLGMVLWIGGLFAALLALSAAQPALARRGLRTLAHPGAAVTVVAGILLVWVNPVWMRQGWLHAKLALVVVLIVLDLVMTRALRTGAPGPPDAGRVRLWHSTVGIVFVVILFLAVLKPF